MIAVISKEEIVQDALKKSITYDEFVNLVDKLATNKGTTGNDQSDAFINFTMLNNRRIKRWNKTLKINDELAEKIKKINKKVTWLVIAESWCGDAAHILPVIHKVAELNDQITLRIVLRDENLELMNEFLTNGGQAIPKLIMIDDETKEILNTFGPRPSEATKMVHDYKAKHGSLSPEFKEDLQRWYNKDKGKNIVQDLINLLES